MTEAFVAEGAHVMIADIDDAAGTELIASLGDTAAFVHCDVAEAANVSDAVDAATERFGALHVMVNNAGIASSFRRLMDDDFRDFTRVMGVDLFGVMVGTQQAALSMGPGGSIINVTSIAGIGPGVGLMTYRAAKAGVAHFSRCAATELAARLQRPSLLAFEAGADVLHTSVEPTGVLRRGDEAEPLIEADSIVVDRVDDDESSGDGLTRGDRLAEGLREQERSASLALVAAVDGEPCQQDHADRIGGEAADELGRRVGAKHGAHGEAEVADHAVVAGNDERAGRVHLLGRERVASQPAVELLVARVEVAEVVVGTEALEAKPATA